MKKNDITQVVEQYLCHSCGSCDSVCNHNSIDFFRNSAGYIFPKINYETCTNCGLCYNVCPGISFKEDINFVDPFIGKVKDIFVAKANDEKIYKNSQSGGVATMILKYLFDNNIIKAAVVTEMSLESSPYNKSKIIYSVEELYNSQKSKYLPTSLNKLLSEVIKIDGKVAIVGLSCHFEGIEKFVKLSKRNHKLKDKIIKIGLICDRVLLETSVDFFIDKVLKVENIKDFVFRDKINTPYPGDMTILTQDNKLYKLDKTDRILMKSFFTPIRCKLCFDKMNIFSDLVIGDPHGIDSIDKNGESLVLVRTNIGQDIVDNMKKVNLISSKHISIEQAIKGQGIENKKKSFSAYLKGWQVLGYVIPTYPNEILKNLPEVSNKEVKRAQKDLQLSLKLTKFNSKNSLLKYAYSYYIKNKSIYKVRNVLSKIKRKGLKCLSK